MGEPSASALAKAREGCPTCGGEGVIPTWSPTFYDVDVAMAPCPECARVARLIAEEREACAGIADHFAGDCQITDAWKIALLIRDRSEP